MPSLQDRTSLPEFQAIHYPSIDEETKAKILELNDPTDNIKKMLIRKNPTVKFWKEAQDDEMSKIFSIFSDNNMRICEKEDLYSNTTECGL